MCVPPENKCFNFQTKMSTEQKACDLQVSMEAKCFPGFGVDVWGGCGFQECSVWCEEAQARRPPRPDERYCWERFVDVSLVGFTLRDRWVVEKQGRMLYYPKNRGFISEHRDGAVSPDQVGVIVILPPSGDSGDGDVFLRASDETWKPHKRGYRAVYIPIGVKHGVGSASQRVRIERYALVVRVFVPGPFSGGQWIYKPSLPPETSSGSLIAPEFKVSNGFECKYK